MQGIFGQLPSFDAFDQSEPRTDAQPEPQQQQAPAQQAPQYPSGSSIIPVGTQQPEPAPMAMAGQWAALEPRDASPEAGLRSAGIAALLATGAVGAGIAIGGAWGAAAGLLLVGALQNGYRAQKWSQSPDPSQKHEAMVSGVFAAAGLGVGSWLAWKAAQERREAEED